MNGSGRRAFVGWLLPFLILAASCSPQNGEVVVPPPASAVTCAALVPIGVRLVEAYAAVLGDLPFEVVDGTSPAGEKLATLIESGAELDARAARLDCNVEDLNNAIIAQTVDLESDDPVVELFLETMRGGVVGRLPARPPSTTTTP